MLWNFVKAESESEKIFAKYSELLFKFWMKSAQLSLNFSWHGWKLMVYSTIILLYGSILLYFINFFLSLSMLLKVHHEI